MRCAAYFSFNSILDDGGHVDNALEVGRFPLPDPLAFLQDPDGDRDEIGSQFSTKFIFRLLQILDEPDPHPPRIIDSLDRRFRITALVTRGGQQLDRALQGLPFTVRSEEHTSELQSRENLVC